MLSNNMVFVEENNKSKKWQIIVRSKTQVLAKGTEQIPWNANQKKNRNSQTKLTEPPTACV